MADATANEKSKWRLSREVSVADLVVVISVLLGVFTWGSSVEARLGKMEVLLQNGSDDRLAIRRALERIDDKMDRFLERQNANRARGTP